MSVLSSAGQSCASIHVRTRDNSWSTPVNPCTGHANAAVIQARPAHPGALVMFANASCVYKMMPMESGGDSSVGFDGEKCSFSVRKTSRASAGALLRCSACKMAALVFLVVLLLPSCRVAPVQRGLHLRIRPKGQRLLPFATAWSSLFHAVVSPTRVLRPPDYREPRASRVPSILATLVIPLRRRWT